MWRSDTVVNNFLIFSFFPKFSWFYTSIWKYIGRGFKNCAEGTDAFISLDGTDFRILEPTQCDPKWYSDYLQKFTGPIWFMLRHQSFHFQWNHYLSVRWPFFWRLAWRHALAQQINFRSSALWNYDRRRWIQGCKLFAFS